jgi:hypothetical protein
MTLPELLEFILLPCVGWLLLNSVRNASRLTRIETMLEMLLPGYRRPKKKHANENEY